MIFPIFISKNLSSFSRWMIIACFFFNITYFSWADSNESGFADSNTFDLDTTDTGTGGHSGFADSNTFPLDTTDTGTGGHSGFADSNAFPLDTTDTGTGGYSGFADSNTFPLDTTDTGTGGHSGFADSNAFPLDTTDTGTGGYSGFADSNTFPLDTTDTGTGGHSGFADSNAFPLNTTDTGTGGYSGFADSNTFPLDTTDTGTGGHSGFADSNAFPLNTTDTGTGGHSGFADSNEFALDTTSDEQNATIYGTVSYVGIIPGPAIVWALDANETVIDQDILSDGNGSYSLTVPIGQGYDFKVFIDGTGDGQPQAYEVWKHHGDWNSSLGKFNLTQVDGNLSGINFNLFDSDYDSDGFTNWQEHQAGSNQNDFNSTPPLEFGLLAHWTFDETNGTVLHDSSGNDLNGTLVGFNNPWSPGRKSGSLRFDGIDDHVTFAGITELNDIRPLSFSGWLKLDHNGSGYVFAKRSQGQGYWRLFASGPSKNWLVRSTTASAPTLQTYEVTPFFHWQHVSLTWNGLLNGQNTKLYIDGSEELSITRNVGSGQIISDADNQFTLGNRPQNNSSFFKGWMDDFRVWNRVITQNEIQALYQGAPVTYATISGNITNTTSVPGPIILWVYDESGTKVAQQTLSDGPGPFTFSLPAGHSYDIKAFADGNQDGELNPSIGEPYTHFGNWNGNGHDLLAVDGNQSNVNLTLNYETDQDNDGFSLWTETQAGSDDNNSDSIPNNPPADLNSTAPLNFAENLPIGSVIGEFNATDPDANSTLAYHFVPGDNNNTFFTLEQNGTLKTASIFDFESNASTYLIQISVTDEYNSTVEGNFTVSLLDAAENLAPLNLTASNFYFDENIPVGNQITSINASDPEGAPLSFSLVSGLGDTHNHLFTLDTQSGWGGGTYGSLKIAVPFNFETNTSTYSVRVEAKDDHNASVSQNFILTLNDINEAPLDLNISNHSIAELTDLTKIHTLNKNITVQNEIINGLLFLEEQDNHFSNIGNSLSRLGELTALHQDILKSQFDRDNYSNEFNQIRDQIGQLSTITYNGENLFTTSPANPYPIEFHLTEDGADANLSSQYAISELKLLNGDASYRYYISINGVDLSSGSIPFNSDLNTTVNDIANAINADSNLSAIVAASKISHSAGIQLIAATPRTAFHVEVQSVGVAQDMEWTTYFLQQQDNILQTIGQIINRMAELKSLTSDPLANQSTIDGAAAEFTGLQSQLSHLRNVKFDTFDLFTTSTSDGNLSFYTTIDGPNPPLSEKVHEVTLDSNLLSSANSIRINGKTISINGLGLSVVAQAINTNSDINSSVHASHSAEDATVVLSSLIPSVIFSCELLDMIGNSIPSGNLTTNIPTEITLNRLNVFEDGTPGKGLISINGYDLTDSSLNPGNGGSLDDYGTADFTNMLETIGSVREINAAYSLYTQIIRSELNSTIGPDMLLDWKHSPSILGITRLNIFEDGEPGDGLKNYIGSLITDLNITTYTHDDGELFTNNLVNSRIQNTTESTILEFALAHWQNEFNASANGELTVGTFSGTDSEGGILEYNLSTGLGDADNQYFTIDGNLLKSTTTIDYENKNTYNILVSVTDQGGLSLDKNFTISVTNENDPPIITSIYSVNMLGSAEHEISVAENSNYSFDINSSDPDGDSLIFEKSGGADQNLFSLNIATGFFNFTNSPDYESPQDADQNNTFEVWFRAKDGNNSYDEKRLTIHVTDVFENTAPSFQSDGNLTVSENTTFVYEFNATDPDGDALSYSILHGPDANLFDLNQSSGVLTFISPKDFEAPEDNNTDNVYQLTIQVADSGAPVSLSLNIEVTDVFENAPPSFQSDGNLTVQENTTFVYEFNATDPNGDALSYSILHGPDASLFDLNQSSGVLTLISPQDFEAPEDNNTDNVYQLTIQVADSGAPVSLSLNIEVTDVFENAPPSFQSEGNLTVQENTTFVYEFNATDPNGDALSYSILHGQDASLFDLNQSSGALTFISPQDFEAPEDNNTDNVYQLTIQVADSGAPVSLNLNIHVTDVFENAPPSFQSDGNLTVSENTTFVYEFNATDPDGDALSYSILHGPDASLFDLNQSSGVLTFISPQDFEASEDNNTDNIYQLTIQVADSGASVSLSLNIEVTDVFENAPPSFQSDGNLTVSENTTFVYEFNATDPDGDALTYSILHGADASLFDLNQASSVLTFISPQDFEAPEDNNTDNIYQLTIQVADSGAPVTLSLNIEVTDEFENAPPSFQSEGNLTVQENTTFVYEFNATDPNGDALSYSILHGPDASLFDLNQSSGVLTFISPQDFEASEDNNTDNIYQLTIQVADSGAPVSLSLNIEVTDEFENAPPSFQSEGNLTVQENTTFVYEFNATDPDGDALSYSILHGPDASLFDLNQSSGVLTFISPQDFEASEDNNTDNIYQLTIQVADSGAPVSLSLNIEVTDVFENAPPSFQSEGNLTVQENTTFVYEFNATDPNGDALSYSILNGPDASLFNFDQASGVLTFISPQDFEAPEDNNTDNIYQLTIQVADSAAPVSLSLNIEVTDEFENAPPSFQSEGNLTVQENTTFVYEFNATDPNGDALSYSILHGPDASLFDLNQSSGVLTFISPQDFEASEDNNTDNIYQLTIQVADSGAPVSLSLNIEVTDEFENAPPSFQSDGNLTVSENTTFVYEFNATDPDGDALSYSILHGPDASLFNFDQSSGVLTFISPQDFEAPEDNNTDNVYQLTIQVADSAAPVSLSLNIEVTDEFEGSHSGGEDQSPDGEAQSPEPNIPDSPINKPIVRVDKIIRLQNGSYFIRGEILTTGGSSILEVGFILSDSIHFNEPIYFNAQKDDETFFSFTVGDLNQDTTYYYRATASNQSGASYSSIKKFRTPRSVHWDENSTELEAGWMFLDWFGSFLPYHNNWIFHSGLGWVYAISDGSNGLWIWSEEYNWQWTRSGVWPFLFSDQTSNWFYFIKRINGQPIFYDYSDSEYLITPLSSP